jgi:PAS domain S-box-containing protein
MSRTTVFDITSVKDAERALQETNIFLDTIVENIPSMIFVKEAASLRFARINRAEEIFLGIPRSQILGKNDHELFPVEQADFFTAKDREALAGYETMDIGEEQLTTVYGQRILHTRKIALRDVQGQPRYLLGISEDITERKHVEKRIQALNRDLEIRANELEAANKELESFSYSVSHDLRSPLRAIDGFARIFEEDYRDKLDDEARRLLRVIRDSTQKMEQLIDDLLTFSRLGRKPIEAARVDMHNVLEDALEEARAGSHTTHTRIVIGELRPAWGDTALLKQVWVNLVSNAIKYSGNNDKAEVEIGCIESGAPGHSGTTYFVRDNGVGFDMRYYEKLFGVFQRLHSHAEFGGTGVGLAIVHRLVRRHGGRVWAEAAVNKGATFYFSLPGEA